MNKENKLVPGLPSGFEDRWNKKLLLKKKLLKAIEKSFIKFGFDPLETPSFEISENIGSFLTEDESNPMSDVFSFEDGERNITLRYDLSSPLARFVAQNNQELPSIYKRYAIQNVFRNEKAGNGRYREFMQADCDIVGVVNPAQANAELCNLIASTLIDCGLNKDQFTINVSNRKIVQGLIEELKISHDQMSKRVGKDRSTITNYMRLLKLDPIIQSGIRDEFISMGHGRALIGIGSNDIQLSVYEKILKNKLSVRQTEDLIKNLNGIKKDKKFKNIDSDVIKIIDEINKKFDYNLKISTKGGKAQISFNYDNKNDLISILKKLNG